MKLPRIKKRRYYDFAKYGKGYLESDNDFIKNNIDLVVLLLDGIQNKTIKIKQVKPIDS